jgi:hypothetical protein
MSNLKSDLESNIDELIPNLKFYYSNANTVYYVLATCPTLTVSAAGNIPIYANPNLTGLIGYMQQSYSQDSNIFKFQGDILFLPFIGSLSYYAIYENITYPFRKEYTFINTILSGTGDLSNVSGKVVSYVNPNESDTQTVYIFFDKK